MNTNLQKKMILLVEDEATTSHCISNIIKRWGYNVITAHSGEEAVETAAENTLKIDLILMDIDLGDGINGTEAAQQILSFCNVPIVFHTSHSEREMVEKVKGITRYGYVIKNSGNFVLQSSIEIALELFTAHNMLKKTTHSLHQLLFSIFYDTTDRKNTENLLKEKRIFLN